VGVGEREHIYLENAYNILMYIFKGQSQGRALYSYACVCVCVYVLT
jgi:hypothetical protein